MNLVIFSILSFLAPAIGAYSASMNVGLKFPIWGTVSVICSLIATAATFFALGVLSNGGALLYSLAAPAGGLIVGVLCGVLTRRVYLPG